jgi:hypothetical protein
MTFITQIEKITHNAHKEHTRPQIAKRILSKNINTGCITTPDFKFFYRAIVIKSAQY